MTKKAHCKAYCTVLCNTSYNINHFLAFLKAETLLKLTKENDHKSPHLANLDRKYPSHNNENTEMLDIKYKTSISECTTST